MSTKPYKQYARAPTFCVPRAVGGGEGGAEWVDVCVGGGEVEGEGRSEVGGELAEGYSGYRDAENRRKAVQCKPKV